MKKNSVVVVLRLALGVAMWLLVFKAFGGWLEPVLADRMPEYLWLILNQMIVPYTLGIAAFYLVAGKMPRKEPGEKLKVTGEMPRKEPGEKLEVTGEMPRKSSDEKLAVTCGLLLKALIIQMGIAIPVATIIYILIALAGGTVENPIAAEMFGANWLFYAVLLLLFNPVMEEILFREMVLDRLLVLGDKSAIVISAVIFAIPHVISQGIPQMFATLIIALVWGYLRVKTGKLWPCMVLHGCFNLLSGYVVQALSRAPAGSVVLMLIFMLILPVSAVVLLRREAKRGLWGGV